MQLEKSEGCREAFIGNIGCVILAASSVLVTIEGKKEKGTVFIELSRDEIGGKTKGPRPLEQCRVCVLCAYYI
jgi:hypothetical protein